MDKTLEKICSLLARNDNLRKCGAALVLAELAPKQKEVVQALGEAIPGSNEQQLSCILEALDAIGSKDAIPYVMPLLTSEDIPTKMRAISIMASGGASVIPLIKEQMDSAPRQYKVVFIDLLSRIHSKESMQILLNMICEKDFQLVKETCDAVRRHVGDASAAELGRLHKQVESFMKSSRAGSERVTASCMLILGSIGLPTAASTLLKYLKTSISPYLRKNALIAMKGINFTKQSAPVIWKQLLPLLKEDDSDTVRYALDVLTHIPDCPASRTNWKKLLKSKAPAVRASAVERLSTGDSIETARFLVGLLRAEETDVREIASRALVSHKKAPSILLAELTSAKDDDYAWRIAKILKPRAETVERKTVQKITTLAAKDMLAGNSRHEALLYFLRHAAPGTPDQVLLEAGTALKKAKKWQQAVDCLRRLIHTPLFNNDVAYDLSVSNLKLSHKDISPVVREKDYALRGFQSLLHRSPESLLERMIKDRSLDAADVFYVGFHFSEQPGSDHEFGEKLLQSLVKKWPKGAEAKAARKKLGLSKGTPDERKKPPSVSKAAGKPRKSEPKKKSAGPRKKK